MKILHILNELKFSGMETMLHSSAPHWQTHGIEIEILATGQNPGDFAGTLADAGYTIHHIPYPHRRPAAFIELHKLLKKNHYDVVHIHTEANFLLHVLCSRLCGIHKIVRTVHSIFRPRPLGSARRHVDRIIARLLQVHFVSPGNSVAKNEKELFFTDSTVIYNWYNNAKFPAKVDSSTRRSLRHKIKIPDEAIAIVTVGNCAPVKQHPLLLEALAILPESTPWIYVHAGKEDDGFPERELAARLNILHRCVFLGSIPNVENLLACCDIYVMCSHYEGFSIAVLEAMASGIPVILTRVPGLNDFLMLFKQAVGVDCSAQKISDGILSLLIKSQDERIKIGSQIAQQCQEMFSIKNGVCKYADLYQKI